MKSERMVFFVATPDSYSDVFDVYLKCFMMNCADSPFELVVATNTKNYSNVKCIPNGIMNDSWEDRALPVLKELSSKYVLIMDDDFFITGKIDYQEIDLILDQMDEHDISYCALTNNLQGKIVEDGSSLVWVKKSAPYARNLQVGIFNREYFIEILETIEDTHEQEGKWNEEAYYAPEDEYYDDIVSCTKEVIPCVHGVAMGKWFPSAIKAVNKLGIQVESHRECLSIAEELRIRVFKTLGKKFSPKLRVKIKKIMKKLGFKFITNH